MESEKYHWRMASSDADVRAIGAVLLVDMFREVGRGTLNPDKAFVSVYECFKQNRAVMIFRGQTFIGTLGLVPWDFWYSDDPWLVEQWSYIAPAYRGPKALRCIFEAARHIAQRDNFESVMMIVFNEERSKAKSPIAHIGEQFAFYPAGKLIEIKARDDEREIEKHIEHSDQ